MLAIKLRKSFLLAYLVLLLIAQYTFTAADAVNPSNAITQRSLEAPEPEGENGIGDDNTSSTDDNNGDPTLPEEGSNKNSTEGNNTSSTDPCATAKKCPDCVVAAAATSLTDGMKTCAFQNGKCVQVELEDTTGPADDMCDELDEKSNPTTNQGATDSPTKAPTAAHTAAPTATKATTAAPTATKATIATKAPTATTAVPTATKATKAPTATNATKSPTSANSNSTHNYGDDEGSGGAIFALLLMFSFVGAVWFNRIKIKRLLDSTDVFDGMGGESSGPASKATKYRDLPSEENDEEWGWGDGNDSSGDVELSGAGSGSTGSYKDEVVHKRHSPGSFESKDSAPSAYGTSPPSSGGLMRSTSNNSAPPQLKSGLSLTSKSSPQPARKSVTKSPMPTTTTPMPNTTQRITSLGKKIVKSPTKPKAVAPQEEDIFASMGLSSKPKFSPHTPGTAKPSPASGTSRWAVPSNTGSSFAAVATTTAATTAATTTPTSNTLSAGLSDAGSDDDWGDDDDLNDLLDD